MQGALAGIISKDDHETLSLPGQVLGIVQIKWKMITIIDWFSKIVVQSNLFNSITSVFQIFINSFEKPPYFEKIKS